MQKPETGIKKGSFPWGEFLKKVAVIAVPVALQNLLTTTGSMVDTMMIASLGTRQVGAVGLCAQFSSLMFACFWGFVGGGMLFFSQYWGAEDDDGINRSYGMTLVCMLTVGVLFCVLAEQSQQSAEEIKNRIAVIQGDTEEAVVAMEAGTNEVALGTQAIREVGIQYLRIAGFSYPLMVLSMGMAALLRCTGQVRIPLYASIVSVLTNIILNRILIFGFFAIPAMGVRGAAAATVMAQAAGILVIVLLAAKRKHPYLLAVHRHFRLTGAFFRVYFRKCFPILMNEIFIGLGNMVINIVLGRQPEEAIAALAVFRTLEGLVIGFFAGFSNAASVLVGTKVGSGQIDLAYERAWRLVYLCQGIIGMLGLTLILLHTPILSVMGMHQDSFRIAFGMICVYAAAGLIRMGNWVQNDTFRAAGDSVYGTVMEIIFMWVVVLPVVVLSGMVWHWPTLLVFACCYVDEPIRYILMQRHLFSGKWIRPVTREGKAALVGWKPER